MNNIIKAVCAILLVVAIMTLGKYLLGRIIADYFNSYVDEEFCIETKEYLESKYNRKVIVEKYTHHYEGAPAIIAHFEDSPEIQFFSYKDYDFYLSTCLQYDAGNAISQIAFEKIQVDNTKCYFAFGDEEELWQFYEQKGRSMTWQDEECEESISNLYIWYTQTSKKFTWQDAQDVVRTIVNSFDEEVFKDCHLVLYGSGNSNDFVFEVSNDKIEYST